jgi:mercuric ion binding protein
MRTILPALILTTLLAWSAPILAASHAYRLYVDGLACPFCAYGVEKNILALKGVQNLDINMNGGFITIVMEPSKVLDEAVAKAAVADSGFTLRAFEVPKGKK